MNNKNEKSTSLQEFDQDVLENMSIEKLESFKGNLNNLLNTQEEIIKGLIGIEKYEDGDVYAEIFKTQELIKRIKSNLYKVNNAIEIVSYENIDTKPIKEFLVKRFLKGKKVYGVKASKVFDKLNIIISQEALNEFTNSVQRDIYYEIDTQLINLTIENYRIDDSLDLSEFLKAVDLSNYHSMSIEDVREYVNVYDEHKGIDVITDKYIQDDLLRACVGIIAYSKGGTFLAGNKDGYILD